MSMFLASYLRAPDKILLLLLLLLLSLVVVTNSNVASFLLLNKVSLLTGDLIWVTLTHLGDAVIIFSFASCLLVVKPHMLKDFILGAILTTVVVQSIKFGLNVSRPPKVLDANSFILLQERLTALSFPSGHAASAFLVASVVYYHASLQRWLQYLVIVLALLVAYSRIAVGVHWPIDVLTGALMGWGFGWLSIIINKKLNLKFRIAYFWLAFIFFVAVFYVLLNNGAVYHQVMGLYWLAMLVLSLSLLLFVYKCFVSSRA